MKHKTLNPRTFSRRDFLKATVLGSGGLLLTKLEWAFAEENYHPSWYHFFNLRFVT